MRGGGEGGEGGGAEGCKVHVSAQIPKFGHHSISSQTARGPTPNVQDSAAPLWSRSVS